MKLVITIVRADHAKKEEEASNWSCVDVATSTHWLAVRACRARACQLGVRHHTDVQRVVS